MKYFLAAAIATLLTAAVLAKNASLSEIRALAEQSRYQDAYVSLEAYLKRRPDDDQGRLLKGVLLTRMDRIDDAIDAFRSLARDKPTLPEPYNNLAVLYAAQGRYDLARESLEKAVALQPGYATARENLGDIYARLAHLEYMRAYEIDGTNTRALDKASTVVNLFERLSKGVARTEPLAEPARITAASQRLPEPPAPIAKAEPMPAPMPKVEPLPAPMPMPIPEPMPALRASASDAVECFSVSGLSDDGDAVAVAAWFEQRGVDVQTGSREETQYLNFHVYSPPRQSREAAKALFNQMTTAGIKDIALIYRGDLANGVSLGVYSTEAAAQRRMTMLSQRGYQVEYRHRSRTRQVPFVEAKGLDGVVNPGSFSQAFPDFIIVPMPCG